MAPPGIPENISLLAAPVLFGNLFNYGLFGILTAQIYVYYLSFPADSKYLKAFIYGLFIVECVQVVMATRDAYAVFGAGWGDVAALDNTHWLWFDIPVMSGLVSASVQSYFAWRIYILSKSPYLGVFVVLIALMQGASGMAAGILVYTLGLTDSAIQARTATPSTVWLGGSAACDVIIAGCMLYFLSRQKHGSARTDAMLSRLIRLTVETGTLTASVACIDLVLFLVFKDNNLHFAPALTLSKLYTNSLMMLFNNRTQMRRFRGGIHTGGGRFWVATEGAGEFETRCEGSASSESPAAPQEFALRKLPNDGSRVDVTAEGLDDLSDTVHKAAAP
ncbi:hypothetical protein OH76DRAFT_1477132 [Lentinus brumalis]|uniref:DUF6534 domain-containing protein n=1 Tax=Lentinus brumalis TaxID=2498619 RepID=A0A371DVG1_9APHY|nr:hypothetical protein OH76DRAFT_1477132 [Polyporus brumalis]